MAKLDFRELHKELTKEFFFYADQKGRSYLDSLMLMYWQARGPAFVGCGANYPGTKFLITTDDASRLADVVPKALMLADHVIIRHASLLPVQGLILDAVPSDFAGFGPITWIERHLESLQNTHVLPHFKSPPPPENITAFIDWLCNAGRSWFEAGRVTYAPVVIPGDVEITLLKENVNLNRFFRDAEILPQEDRLLNQSAAAALAQLNIPYLKSVTPELLDDFKEEERGGKTSFSSFLLQMLDQVGDNVSSPEFSREVEKLSLQLQDRIRETQAKAEEYSKKQSWRRIGVELLGMSALVCYYLGAPEGIIITGGLAGLELAKSIKEGLEEKYSLEQDPLYFLAKLGNISKTPKTWQATIRKK